MIKNQKIKIKSISGDKTGVANFSLFNLEFLLFL